MSRTIQIHPFSVALGALTVLAAGMLSGWARGPDPLGFMSVVQIEDGFGNMIDTVRFTGCNVQIVNGLDETGTVNGAGNLIVGYNEAPGGPDRTGSHNIVGGAVNNYSCFGGLVVGQENAVAAPWGSVSGGIGNVVAGYGATMPARARIDRRSVPRRRQRRRDRRCARPDQRDPGVGRVPLSLAAARPRGR